ncbi:uncharacterized protein LOC131650531 [Vicia villosa]|uniref:uncharacterized protein LOC131650531 n=1 Tax=Vicia villosa TaxID=3911 RepID=UPI00273BBC12|nr:uncharacterized protein LOC131650531 [Vicia villosa]
MEENESITNFFTRVTKLVSQIKVCGEVLTSRLVVAKILRSLAPELDHVVVAIEESKDLSIFKKEELQGMLESHEQRLKELQESRGRGGGRKPDKSHIQCFNCQKYAHYASYYLKKQKNQQSDTKFAKHEEEETMLVVTTRDEERFKYQWYLDSGCLSHMSGKKDWFVNIKPPMKAMVKFSNDNTLAAEGIGDVMIIGTDGKRSIISNGLYILVMKSNLLSIGQLVKKN